VLDDKPYTLDRIFRLGLAAALAAGLIWLVGYLSDALIPFALALLAAYMLNPLVELLQKGLRLRGLAVAAALILVAGVLAGLAALVGPMIASEVSRAAALIGEMVSDSPLAQRAAAMLPPDLWQALKDLMQRPEVKEVLTAPNLWKGLEAVARQVLPGIWGILSGTASVLMWVVGLAVVGLYLIFLLADYRKISAHWATLAPPAYRQKITQFASEFEAIMSAYFRGQALVAALVGVMAAAGFALIGLPLGILLGLFLGLLNMVPYLGLAAVLPAAFLGLVHSLDAGMSLWVVYGLILLVFAVVQVIQDAVLVPRIMGKVTGLSPWLILLSLSVWGKLLGLLGLIIALPATFLVLAYYRRMVLERNAQA